MCFRFGRAARRPAHRHARRTGADARRAFRQLSRLATRWGGATYSTRWRIRAGGSGWRHRGGLASFAGTEARQVDSGRAGAGERGGDAVRRRATGPCGRAPTAKGCGESRAGRAAVYDGGRAVQQPDPLACTRTATARCGSALSAAVWMRLRDGRFQAFTARRRAAERQHRQHCRRWRIALAGHHAGHLPDCEAPAARVRRGQAEQVWSR